MRAGTSTTVRRGGLSRPPISMKSQGGFDWTSGRVVDAERERQTIEGHVLDGDQRLMELSYRLRYARNEQGGTVRFPSPLSGPPTVPE